MSLADPLILVILAVSGVLAMFRGFTLELLGLIALVLAALIAILGASFILDWFAHYLPKGMLGTGIAIGGLFLVALVPLWILSGRIGGRIRESNLGFLDRSVGFAFGVLRGLFLLAVAYLIFGNLVGNNSKPEWIADSRLMPIVSGLAELLMFPLKDSALFALLPSPDSTVAGTPASDYIHV